MNRSTTLIALLAFAFFAPVHAQDAALDDAQIAHIAYTAGQLDIEAAQQALEKSTNPQVREFAATMLRDHEAVNAKALALVQKLGVTPAQNAVSSGLSDAAAEARRRHAGLDGAAFDRAYTQNEVDYHAQVNGALRDTLIPAASNAELRALLESGLALFSAHQRHAEQLAASLR